MIRTHADSLSSAPRPEAIRALVEAGPEESFDRLTQLCRRVLGVPVALVTLLGEDRQYFKSCVGLPEPWQSRRETPLSHSFCQHVVATEEPLIVEDAREDALLRENLAIRDLGVIAYAGIPLRTKGGEVLGSFCAIDSRPRRWSEAEIATLHDLAACAATEVELRLGIDARQQAEALVRGQRRVLEGIASGAPMSTILTSIVELAEEQVHGIRGSIRLVDESGAHLVEGAAPHLPAGFREALRQVEIGPACGSCGTAAHRRVPVVVPDVAHSPLWDGYREAALRYDLHACWAVPIFSPEGEVRGTFAMYSDAPRAPTPRELHLADIAAHLAGIAIERRRAETERAEILARERRERAKAEEAGRRARLLSDTSSVLTSSMEYAPALQNVARLVVPALADICYIDVVEEDGEIRRLAIAHADPERQSVAAELYRYPPDPTQAHGVPRVLRSGRPQFFPELSDDHLEAIAVDEDHLRLLRALQPRSAVLVPLVARGHTLGAITFASAESGRRYSLEDLVLTGELARRVAMAVDSARLYEAALVANQAKADFLAVMSHELRTPLNAILGYADLLQLGIPSEIPAAAQRHVDRIDLSARHLLQLIEEILTHARLEAGREQMSHDIVELEALSRDVQSLMEPLAWEKGLRFSLEVDGTVGTLETDARKLRQILLNLLSNAVKFTEEGEVSLSVTRSSSAVRIEVRDTGVGIHPDHLERIFEPFWQVEQTKTRRGHGTGLGLNVVQQLAGLLGGEVKVHSRPGEGSRFVVLLPASPGDPG